MRFHACRGAMSLGQSKGGLIGFDPSLLVLAGLSHTKLYADKDLATLIEIEE